MNKTHAKKWAVGIILLLAVGGWAFLRFGAKPGGAGGPPPGGVAVKAMQTVQRDTPLSYEYVGKLAAKNEVKIVSKVGGNIVGKMVNGGDVVKKGQPLFQIDNKQYLSLIASARAALAKSQVTLQNTQRDVERYRKLAAVDGVARQTLDQYEAQAAEQQAAVEENRASLQRAIEDERDTLIVSPVDGRIDTKDLALGQFVTAGSTTLATVSSLDPIWVQFNMSENEYIKLVRLGEGSLTAYFKDGVKLLLSDGSEYPLRGAIEQIDSGIGDDRGTITLKASFDNAQRFLLPGMFAKVVAQGGVRSGAILIPQRAVRELLDETFVTVVNAQNQAESRKVKMGERIGNLWLVESGLAGDERVVVEGIDKVKQGTPLQLTMVTLEDVMK